MVVFLLFIKSQLGKHSKCPPHESMHAWTRLKMDCPWADANGLRGIKYVLVKCPFSIAVRVFKCFQNKSMED